MARNARLLFSLLLFPLLLLALPALAQEAPSASCHAHFDELKARNPDIIGWLVSRELGLSEAVVHADMDGFYRDHAYTRANTVAGAVCLPLQSSACFSDDVTLLYGPSAKTAERFPFLTLYADSAYLRAHPSIELLTPQGDYALEFFAFVNRRSDALAALRGTRFKSEAEFNDFIRSLLADARAVGETLPAYGDKLVALHARTDKYGRTQNMLFGYLRPLGPSDPSSADVLYALLDIDTGFSRLISVPGRGKLIYYAQNDPRWRSLIYAPDNYDDMRRLGSGGCAPASAAILFANLLGEEGLSALLEHVDKEKMTICPESVTDYHCSHTHYPYKLQTYEDYMRFMPLAMANIACGNNDWRIEARTSDFGSSVKFIHAIADSLGLRSESTTDPNELAAGLRRGGLALLNTGGRSSPFTNTGHYMVAVGADEESIYIFDPFLRYDYEKTDPKHLVTVVEPGLVRVSIAKWHNLIMGHALILYPYAAKP